MRREFLMLAHRYNPESDDVGGCYISEKLDGTRCFWDGGISRGMPTEQVPWANINNPKTGKRKTKIKPESTGLWSRYGNPIIAPDWWLNQLPCIPLDGELWAGRGGFQICRSICSRDLPSSDWENIDFAVIGSPPFEAVFSSGQIKNSNMVTEINFDSIKDWLSKRPDCSLLDYRFLPANIPFENELAILRAALPSEGHVYLLNQTKLPMEGTKEAIDRVLDKILDDGGEGVVIRRPESIWTPKRSHDIMKYKPFTDDEGVLVGFTSGRETDKGSKHLGKIGALILDYNGKRLELSGLTDAEREFATDTEAKYAAQNPGKDMPPGTLGKHFTPGQTVTFIYRELSNDGVPREGRYSRICTLE